MDKYTNTDINPVDVDDYPWLYEMNKNIQLENINNPGKWMLFYDKNLLNQKWSQSKSLYREEKFYGVIDMKCSTSYDNSRSSHVNSGVIILYCNNSEDEETIKKTGKTIKNLLSYAPRMYYKTDAQTYMGTKKNKKNYIYKLD
jgi:hypothetical protein